LSGLRYDIVFSKEFDAMATKTGPHRAEGVKPLRLAEIRLRSGRSLEEIADTTKISIRFLRAIEAEDFGQLPGGIFSRSYLRQYAEQVGIEASRLLETYRVRMDAEEVA
jgi:cytoskeletal protein RodZ